MAPFEITDKKEVAANGDPSYTSAVHKWNGTIDILNAKAVNKNTIARICNGLPLSNPVISEKLMVPVAPYINEIPNNNIPEENAEERIIFIAASEDIFLSKSKLAMAATGMVA